MWVHCILTTERSEPTCKMGNCTVQMAFSINFVEAFAPFPDLHNSFSESDSKITQTVCANKQHHQWAQFILCEFTPPSVRFNLKETLSYTHSYTVAVITFFQGHLPKPENQHSHQTSSIYFLIACSLTAVCFHWETKWERMGRVLHANKKKHKKPLCLSAE